MQGTKPILVTGSHRSGSTWVGRMLSVSQEVAFIWEPLSPASSKGICCASIDQWFIHIHEGNEHLYSRAITDVLQFRYHPFAELRQVDSPKRFARMFRDAYRNFQYRKSHCRPLLKDPIAIMSTEWLAETFGMDIVILIRNPFAFCASIKQLRFNHPFMDFLRQEQLLNTYLSKYTREIEEFAHSRKSYIEQGCLLWNIIHHVIYEYRVRHQEWNFFRHEDLSLHPELKFEELYGCLSIDFTPEVKDKIKLSTGRSQAAFGNKNLMVRDSRLNLNSWRKHLTLEETQYIHRSTTEYLDVFYPDWNELS